MASDQADISGKPDSPIAEFLSDPPRWTVPYYAVYRFFRAISEQITRTYQRIRYGFSYHEVWNLREEGAKWFLPRLKALQEGLHGHPVGLTEEEWEDILIKITKALELYADDSFWESTEAQRAADEGMKLFAEYYAHLWD